MVDEVLSRTGAVQSRIRDLPSRVVVYLLLAGCLFADLGYSQVWHRLVAGLGGLPVPAPSASALTKARRRIGVTPLRALFDLLRGPAAAGSRVGVYWRGLLVCAIDGTIMTVADSTANLSAFTKQRGGNGGSSYPMMRLVAVVSCGTRTVINAVFGPASSGETTYATAVVPSLRPGMIMLADRNFAAGYLIAQIAATGADLLIRTKTGRGAPKLPVLHRNRDGSYLSVFGGVQIRVIDAEITIATTNGQTSAAYRLITTLLDHHGYPALDMVRLYHERWEIETAYLELKSSILSGRVLRARTPAGVDQEVYALLITHQILRTAMADATSTQPDIDPDRASFTIALHAARDQIIHAAGVIADTIIDLIGEIGRLVLANLLPSRRTRINPRTIKRAMSKYNAKSRTINRTTYKATININILTRTALTTRPDP